MTWVLGWPLYHRDAIKIAKKHNLVKDPNADDYYALIQAARLWVADQVGIIPVLGCWVNDMPEIVYAAYVDYGSKPRPPRKLVREEMMSRKQHRLLKRAMPLKDFGWYQHNDPSCVLYKDTVYVDIEDEDEGREDDHDTDSDTATMSDLTSHATNGSDDGAESDTETVTDGAISRADVSPNDSNVSGSVESLSTVFDANCTIVDSEARP
ncbi:uncharacterized protein C8Q71DRAFT_744225 [Rhodofomes roseus]|uniref:Uncharacterized protein n=1 Tax=Rhodofomes roseus TaxID=34475 RepID=A0ABQ8KPL4_9APHY|nr:uncharacterized protein C8Q71DRAFT_744225 [Rhodofomes roseus]KAH9839797.1 hypothetical protein C8Q71DRAFT_744225 [Rhodofomes roseus]